MPTAIYQFTRGSNTKDGSISALFSQNRTSTDALIALTKWCSEASNRRYETVKEIDEELVATLTWEDSDHRAGSSLEVNCESVGIIRKFVNQS